MLLQHQDVLYLFCGCSILCEKIFLALQHTIVYRANIRISKSHSYFYKKFWDIYQNFLLFGCFQMLWLQLVVDMREFVIHCMECILLYPHFAWHSNFFCLRLNAFVPMICHNDVFLQKATTGVALNTFPNVSLIFNICQCLLIISLIFGKVRLYVPKMELRSALVLLKRVDLFRLSTFLIWFLRCFL